MGVRPADRRTQVTIYNHAYTIAFSVETDKRADNVTEKELLHGLASRLADLIAGRDPIMEAVGAPFDSYIVKEDTEEGGGM